MENGDFFLGGDFTWYGTGHANWARVDDRRVLVGGILFLFPNIPLPDFLHFLFSLSYFPTFILYPCLLIYSELAVFNMVSSQISFLGGWVDTGIVETG